MHPIHKKQRHTTYQIRSINAFYLFHNVIIYDFTHYITRMWLSSTVHKDTSSIIPASIECRQKIKMFANEHFRRVIFQVIPHGPIHIIFLFIFYLSVIIIFVIVVMYDTLELLLHGSYIYLLLFGNII